MKKVLDFFFQGKADFSSLYQIVEELRGEKGCPWDKKQTPQTLKKYLLEETYELFEAIEEEEPSKILEELGDLFFLLLFIAYLYEEKQIFTLKDLVLFTFEKMIRRHPHVFGEEVVKTSEEVLVKWQKIKEKEGKSSSLLGNIPKSLPALQRAFRIGERAGRVGFDWEKPQEVLPKVYEELKELEKAISQGEKIKIKEELGDLLFAVANLSRKLEINPEEALKEALNKFEERFKMMERMVKERKKNLSELTLTEMDELWESIKGS